MMVPTRRLRAWLCAALWITSAGTAAAQNATAPSADDAATGLFTEIWQRDSLSGGWDGLRDRWTKAGFLLAADTIDEVLGNSSGGVRTGAIYEGRLEVLARLMHANYGF